MSNAFAIAAVTAALKRRLLEALTIANNATGALPAGFVVSADAPDRIAQNNGAVAHLNLFLYEVEPNTGWSSQNLPARDSAGARVDRPPLALDLFYLLSVHGIADLDAEILLGHAMQVLHETPGLSRDTLLQLLDPTATDAAAGCPQAFRRQAVQLTDHFESIRLSPVYKKPDDMSKIWSSLQSHYRMSVVYQATVVLIDSLRPARTALPVLTRGLNDTGPLAQASLIAPIPTLLAVWPDGRQPAVNAGGKFRIFGHHLRGTNLSVVLRHAGLGFTRTVQGTGGATPALVVRAPDPDGADAVDRKEIPGDADTCLEVDLAQATGTSAAGWHSVQVVVRPPGDTQDRMSNTLPIAVAPQFATAAPNPPAVTSLGGGRYRVTVTCTPPLHPSQVAGLIVGQSQLVTPPLPPPPAPPAPPTPIPPPITSLVFEGPIASTGAQLARLRVDGVDSLFIQRPIDAPPSFDPSQFIQIP